MKILIQKIFSQLHDHLMKFLTETERCQLKLQHKRERDGRIRDRIYRNKLKTWLWTSPKPRGWTIATSPYFSIRVTLR